jgi:transposase
VTQTICGVDVSSTTLDARIGRDGEHHRFEVSPEGLDKLVAFCRTHQVSLVVMEATGGYERRPAGHLWAAALPTAIVNPRAVRRFAEAMGRLEKTDRIDCGIIAWYAETKRIQPTPPASATQARLTALVRRLRQLTDHRTQQDNQRHLVTEPEVLASFAPILAAIAAETRRLEALIAQAIGADPLWAKLDAAFRSIKGVADRTVARLMAEMPEIGTLSNKAVGKLAGLAPIARDSGQHSGKRKVRGGREGVRSILFVIAELVRRYDPDFKAFHQRLCDAGKPKKLIRIALARKLLVRLNAKAREVRQNFAVAA